MEPKFILVNTYSNSRHCYVNTLVRIDQIKYVEDFRIWPMSYDETNISKIILIDSNIDIRSTDSVETINKLIAEATAQKTV